MWRETRWLTVIVLVLLGLPAARAAAEGTHTIRPRLLRIEVALEGVFEGREMAEVSYAPQALDQAEVLWAAPAGAVVKKGDVLVKLDTEGLDKRIASLEARRTQAAVALKQAREELRMLEKATPANLAWARRAKRIVDEDFARYMERDFPVREQLFEFEKRGHEYGMTAIQLEHDELKRMYEASDLIEATEKAVMMQQELRLARAQLGNELTKKFDLSWRTKVEWPRDMEERKRKLFEAELALDRAEALMPLELERKRTDVARMERDDAAEEQLLAGLKADREAMVLVSPADGIVYYGECVRGRWPSATAMAGKLRRGGRIEAGDVIMTLVTSDAMLVRARAEEKDLDNLQEGLAAVIVPTGYPRHAFAGKVEAVAVAPGGPAPYSIVFAVDGESGPVVPGMTCRVVVLAYEKNDAITVPAGAVFRDDADIRARFVYVKTPDGGPARRPVTVGREQGGTLEIVEGLSEGDVVFVGRPRRADH